MHRRSFLCYSFCYSNLLPYVSSLLVISITYVRTSSYKMSNASSNNKETTYYGRYKVSLRPCLVLISNIVIRK